MPNYHRLSWTLANISGAFSPPWFHSESLNLKLIVSVLWRMLSHFSRKLPIGLLALNISPYYIQYVTFAIIGSGLAGSG
jgi:hypothetical protein